MPVRVRVKYADGSAVEQIREGGKVMATRKTKARATAPTKVTRAQPNKGTVAVDYPEEAVLAYCMKCKEKVVAEQVKKTTVSGKNAIKGVCTTCGTKVFKFTGGTVAGGKKTAAAKKTATKAEVKSPKLSRKAQSAGARLQKAGVLEDNWCGQLKSGAAVWWEGSAVEGWRLCMDDIAESEMPEFKRFVLKSL